MRQVNPTASILYRDIGRERDIAIYFENQGEKLFVHAFAGIFTSHVLLAWTPHLQTHRARLLNRFAVLPASMLTLIFSQKVEM